MDNITVHTPEKKDSQSEMSNNKKSSRLVYSYRKNKSTKQSN